MGSGPVGCRFELPGEIATAYDVNERAILNLHWVGLVLTRNFLAGKQDPGAGYRFGRRPVSRKQGCGIGHAAIPDADLAQERVGTGTGGGGEGLHPLPPVLFKRSKGGDRKGDAFRPSVLLRYHFVGAVAFVQAIANSSLVAMPLLN
jgi:hypothetical protein